MFGIIVAIILSWVLLWVIERQSILALGFLPVGLRLVQFTIAFFFTSVLCALIQIVQAAMMSIHWKFNPSITYADIANHFWWNIKSVLFEEFLFRGALLYIAIKRLGSMRGILLSAICFGIYHWFSFNVFGNIVSMIVVFIATGIMGMSWAYAFNRTGSMALPIGFHLGWNFTFNSIFSHLSIGPQIFSPVPSSHFNELTGIPFLINLFLQNLLPPLAIFLFVRFCFSNRNSKSETSYKHSNVIA